WGTPPWDAHASKLEHNLHHSLPVSVMADFGPSLDAGDREWEGAPYDLKNSVRYHAFVNHHFAGNLALLVVGIGIAFAFAIYYFRGLDPQETADQFPAIYRFLSSKWYFDELYSVILVRPALVVAHWFKWFDLHVIDGIIHGVAWLSVRVAKWDGFFDKNVIDGLVNVVGNTIFAIGNGLRRVQTGFLRSYVLFLVLAAVGIFVALKAL